MQIVNLKFQTREKVNKKLGQEITRFFGRPSSQNAILESALRNAIDDKKFQCGFSS